MAPRLRSKFCNKQGHYKGAKDRHKDNEGTPRTWRCIGIRVIEKGKMPEEKQIVDEADEPAKHDRSKSGHDPNENCN